MLKIRNLYAYYGPVTALSGVTCHIKEGEIVALIGANGAGKTTLLNAVCGLVRTGRARSFFRRPAHFQAAAEAWWAWGFPRCRKAASSSRP